MRDQIEMCNKFCTNFDTKYDHITSEEREVISSQVKKAESWLAAAIKQQDDMPKYSPPVLTLDSIDKQRKKLLNVSSPIMTKPKPKNKPTPSPVPAAPAPEASVPNTTETVGSSECSDSKVEAEADCSDNTTPTPIDKESAEALDVSA